jgi:hypothetical protein
MKITVDWEPTILNAELVFRSIGADTHGLLEHGLDVVAGFAVRDLKTRTPGEVLPDKWEAQKKNSPKGHVMRRLVTNTDKRAYRMIKLRGGGKTNLMEMLEYGTNPTMPIFPVKAKALRFVARSGDVVFASKVNPKGIRAYSMVRLSRGDTVRRLDRLAYIISQRWSRKYGTTS